MTKPSLRMLKSLIETTLDDDVFREDKTTMQFEREVALMFGYEAGCFVLSGTMANQLALRGLLQQPPYAILCDEKAHIINYEGGGPAFTCSALVQPVAPVNGKYLTVTDIEKHAITSYDVHKCPTQVVCMENTCAGMVVPIRELQEIRKWTEQHGIKTHLDGARIWEALTVDPTLLKRYHDLVDCMTVDFSKGLGAPMGAMILGDSELIRQIRRVRKSVGGGFRQAGVLSSLAWAALRENFGERGIERSPLQQVHQMAAVVSNKWTSRGGDLLYPVETNQVWVDLKARSIRPDDFKRMGEMHNVILDGPRIVLHHQISQEALRNLDAVFERSLS